MNAQDFLLADYQLKTEYLNAHFGRMWMRFNFFVTIQSALLGFLLISDEAEWSSNALYFVLAGITLTLLWWVFGSQDRALVVIYRDSVKEAASRIAARLSDLNPETLDDEQRFDSDIHYVGHVNRETSSKRFNPIEWRAERFSITKLAGYFPLVIMLLWLLVAWLVPLPTELTSRKVPTRDTVVLILIVLDLILIAWALARSGNDATKTENQE